MMVAATPFAKAPPSVVILTEIRSHGSTARLPVADAQQFGGFGPSIVAMMPVATKVRPQSTLQYISAVAVSAPPKALSRILKVKPTIVVL